MGVYTTILIRKWCNPNYALDLNKLYIIDDL